MKALGARLQIVPGEGGGMTEKLTCDMIEAALPGTPISRLAPPRIIEGRVLF